MKLHFLKNSRSILLIPLATLVFASGAQACSWDDANCQVNEIKNAANNQARQIRDDATNQAKQIRDDANNQAKQIKSDANTQAKNIADDANSYAVKVVQQAPIDAANIVTNAYRTADQIRATAVIYVENSADISTALYGDLISQAVTVYSQSSGQILNTYNAAIIKANALEKAAETAAIQEAGAAALKKNGAKLLALNNQMMHLNKEDQASLNRILRAISTGVISDQSRKDMESLAKNFGLFVGTSNDYKSAFNVPSDDFKSNFSICLGGNGAYGGGAYASFCFAMDISPSVFTNTHSMAIIENLGLTMGYGLGVGGSLTWSPDTIAQNEGANYGFQATVAPSVDAGMSWNLPTSKKDLLNYSLLNAIPSFTLGFGAGTPLCATINVGGTFTIQEYK